jgi:Cu-processing system permease protein
MTAFVIASLTFQEAARRKILLAALLMGIVFLAIYGIGFHYVIAEMERSSSSPGLLQRNEITNFLMMAGCMSSTS